MSMLAALGIWSLLGTSLGQLDRPLTMVLPAAPVPRIISQLSAASGVRLEATPVLARDVVLIDVHERPLSDIMKRIAEVTDGAWKNDKGTYRLTRSATAERSQEARERKHRMEQIAEEISRSKDLRQSLLTLDKAKALRQQFEKLREKNPRYSFDSFGELSGPLNMAPGRRALLRTIASLELSDLAMLEPGERIVYSNKPTKTERMLPFSPDDVFSKFVQEQNIWASATGGVGEGGPNRMAGDPLDSTEPVSQPPDRLLLVANRSNSSAPVQFQMYLIAGETTLDSENLWLGSDSIRSFSRDMMSGKAPSGTKITLRPESVTMLVATKGFMNPNQGPMPGPSPAAIELLTHPETIDPLGLVPTDGFVSIAESKHVNLIASLPDELVGLNFLPNSSTQTLESFGEMATGIGDLQMSEKDGWLTVKPWRPYSAQLLRTDRDALGKYLRSIVSEGRASLNAEAEFALNSQPTDYDTFGVPMGMLLDVNSTQNVDQDWVTLKLWGALSAEQRNTLIDGRSIPFKALTQSEFALAEREAYHHPFKSFSAAGPIRGGKDLRRTMEPTECLPDGLPPDGQISVSANGARALLASSTTKNVRVTFARVFDEEQLGSSLAYYESAQGETNPMFDRFQLIKRMNYAVSYVYTDAISDHVTLHDVVVPSDTRAVSFGELPKDVQDRILASKQQAKANPMFAPVRRTPPP